jgi:F-type H+-transporting ATPase subunit epsilon
MAEGAITLEIVTPSGPVLREDVSYVAAPSVKGELGVLPGHVPVLAALRAGIVTYARGGEEKRLAIAEGFLELADDRALILTDKVMRRDAIDPVPVRLELAEVARALEAYAGELGAPEWQELIAREAWAAVQLELYGDPPIAIRHPLEREAPPLPVREAPRS